MARILIVEDDGTMAHVLRVVLESRGHEVIEADDGSRGLAAAQRRSPDVMILDLMMPMMDGFAALEALAKDERTATIPVLVISALRGQKVEQRCYSLGAKHYVRKPFDSGMLIGVVEELASPVFL
jgi:two-component system, OmpR family, response regulator RpaA